MKKKTLIIVISACALALLIGGLVALTLLLGEDSYGGVSLDKTKYDYISDVSYNGVSIVGKDGSLYLEKDGELVSDAYSYIVSLNDFYGDDVESVLAYENASRKIYDLYIAQKAESSEYYLISSIGEKNVISGENYTIESVMLPIIVLRNNTNGCHAIISLEALNSDLSDFSGNYIYPTEFNAGIDIATKSFDKSGKVTVCDYITARQEREGRVRTLIFSASGSLIVSSERIESFEVVSTSGKASRFFCDVAGGNIYSLEGELMAKAVKSFTAYDSYAVAFTDDGVLSSCVCFDGERLISAASDRYEIESAVFTDGGVILKDTIQGDYAVISTALTSAVSYDRITDMGGYLLAQDQLNKNYIYLGVGGEILLEYESSELTHLPELSYGGIYVFKDTSKRDMQKFIFATPGKDMKVLNLALTSTLESASLYGGEGLREGIFIEHRYAEDGESVSLYTPFESNGSGNKYDFLRIFKTHGILFALGADCTEGRYDIIDLPANKVAASYSFETEKLAGMSFELIDTIQIIMDPSSENGSLPILVLSVKNYINNANAANSARYIALYRNACYGSRAFAYANLNVFDFGMAGLLDKPITAYGDTGYFSLNTASGTELYCINANYEMMHAASVSERVRDIVKDASLPEEKYLVTETADGLIGLCDIAGNEIFAPYYTALCFIDNGYIGLSRGGAYGVLRYLDGRIATALDFNSSAIKSLGSGFIVTEGGQSSGQSLYIGSQLVESEGFTGGRIICDYAEGSDGFEAERRTAITIDGKLYIHSLGVRVPVSRNYFNTDTEREYTELNERAKLVYYYDGDELVGKDLILPNSITDPSELDGMEYTYPTRSVWHNAYGERVDAEDILNSPDHFITLYSYE